MTQIRQTVDLDTARDLAERGLIGDGFEKSLAELGAMNYAQVDVVIDYGPNGTSTVGIAPVNGIMVGFFLPSWVGEQVALPGGEQVNGLHITLAYLGELDALNVNQQRTLIGVCAELARDSHALRGVLRGINTFPAEEGGDGAGYTSDSIPLYAGVDVPGLFELRGALLRALDDAKIPYDKTHPNYVPHVTLAYVDPEAADEDALTAFQLEPVDVTLRELTVAIGGAHFTSTLFGEVWDDYGVAPEYQRTGPSAYRPTIAVAKALTLEEERRFTLAPMYLPDTLDGHGEWVDGLDLEQSFHDFMADFAHEGIRLQHEPAVVAGKVVEGYILREPLEVEVPVPGNETVMEKHLYPAGTPMIGTRWEPWAWPLVKDGTIRGYSMGGTATPVDESIGA
jgi:2'-5' RNA ligase